jgi:hypothetical protein
MVTITISEVKNTVVADIPRGNVFKDGDGDLYIKTETGAVAFGDVYADHYLDDSDRLSDYPPYTDLGPIQIKSQ